MREKDETMWHNGLPVRDQEEDADSEAQEEHLTELYTSGACVRQGKAKAEKEQYSRSAWKGT